MDVIEIHRASVDQYKDYINSFIGIHDEDIRVEVENQLNSGKLWPEPLVQFNPSYQAGNRIDSLVAEGVIHNSMASVFKGFQIHWHQEQAWRLGAQGKSFVVTSGTGSGKSLTYIGTVFNHLFTHGHGNGVKALVVYPMNALINSQEEELRRHAERYKESSGNEFPITFRAYTGQTQSELRRQIQEAPPDILLTNYMMLELLLTRESEHPLRNSIFSSLEFLALDELHTYRGRQGADISYLIRRIKAHASKGVMCMGTSATMSSQGDYEQRKAAVASVSSTIFGELITPDQVIGEQLERSLEWGGTVPSGSALLQPFELTGSIGELKAHPLAVWLENTAALKPTEHGLQRRIPLTVAELAEKLSQECSVEKGVATQLITNLLAWIAAVNKKQTDAGERYTCLPFRLHQFFAQTGCVYATLGTPGDRVIKLEPGIYEGGEDDFIYPHVFSRASGFTYIPVHIHQDTSRLLPREFNDNDMRKGNDFGYLIPQYPKEEAFWSGSQDDLALLPTSWTNQRQSGELTLVKAFRSRAPIRIFYNKKGYFSTRQSDEFPFQGWFMSAAKNGLLFDPTAGLFFDGNTSERTKLTSLGNEGRSTSTTITSFILLNRLAEAGFATRDQKLLSFTDNRQDAALQSGHFNDFIRTVRIRSAIHQALIDAENHQLNSSQLGVAVREAMGLDLNIYSDNPSPFPLARQEIEGCLEKYLVYQAIYDLRRGWRVVLPNLEKCALLEIEYKDLKENAEFDEGWRSVPILNAITAEQRQELLRVILDYFRLSYALTSNTWLEQNAISQNVQSINSNLRPEWRMKEKGEVNPNVVRRVRLHRRYMGRSVSMGLTTGLGKYIKQFVNQHGVAVHLDLKTYEGFLDELLSALSNCGYISHQEYRDEANKPTLVYQLKLESIIWKLGNGKDVRRDVVKQRSYLSDLTEKPNPFFQKLYQTRFKGKKHLTGADHTGQLGYDDRIDREERFRAEGQDWDEAKVKAQAISALFCSPTMELGVDISQLSVVHMRNAPPNPANYAQRSGRAGRSGQTALVFS